MELQKDAIVDIAPSKVGYFGGPGKMLLPSPATVAAMIKNIPQHKILTTDLLRKQLADQFNVQGTCPVTTKKALQTLANDPTESVPYWRVIKQNGELNAIFPGGVAAQADLLRQEGFTIDTNGKVPKVKQFKANLVRFDQEGASE
jgi:alkylated DNA nucleotide flippase Atl1